METTSNKSTSSNRSQSAIERKASASDAEIQKAWGEATSAIETLYEKASTKLQETVQERPYVALAAAAGLGFVLGGGLGSVTGRFLLRTTAQLVVPGVLATLRAED